MADGNQATCFDIAHTAGVKESLVVAMNQMPAHATDTIIIAIKGYFLTLEHAFSFFTLNVLKTDICIVFMQCFSIKKSLHPHHIL